MQRVSSKSKKSAAQERFPESQQAASKHTAPRPLHPQDPHTHTRPTPVDASVADKGLQARVAQQVGLGHPGHDVHAGGQAEGGQRAPTCGRDSTQTAAQRQTATVGCRHRQGSRVGEAAAPGKVSAWMFRMTVCFSAATACMRPPATLQLLGRKVVPKLHRETGGGGQSLGLA
jgi:hypothetical protein